MPKKEESNKGIHERFSKAEEKRVDIELDRLDNRVGVTLTKAMAQAILDEFIDHAFTTFYAIMLTAEKDGVDIDDCFKEIKKRVSDLLKKDNSPTAIGESICVLQLCEFLNTIKDTILIKEDCGEIRFVDGEGVHITGNF